MNNNSALAFVCTRVLQQKSKPKMTHNHFLKHIKWAFGTELKNVIKTTRPHVVCLPTAEDVVKPAIIISLSPHHGKSERCKRTETSTASTLSPRWRQSFNVSIKCRAAASWELFVPFFPFVSWLFLPHIIKSTSAKGFLGGENDLFCHSEEMDQCLNVWCWE